MSTHTAEVIWSRGESDFLAKRYSRRHLWRFDGGVEVVASSSPHVVPLPWSDPAAVDPEEAFVASLSSCHMLWFLSLAAEAGFLLEHYRDTAQGEMARDSAGRWWMTRVALRPELHWGDGQEPSRAQVDALHQQAHEACFIANSVKTEVIVQPVPS